MYPRRYNPHRSPFGAPNPRDVVPRELAEKIAHERDLLLDELKRTQMAYKQVQHERQLLAKRLNSASAERPESHRIKQLETELAEMTRQRDAATYSSELLANLEAVEVKAPEAQDSQALIKAMLTLRDSIERASNMTTDQSNPWKQGLDNMVDQFDEIVAAHGVEVLGACGEPFDPEVHEAVEVRESELDGKQVIEVARRGFAHKDSGKLIRPAQVVVSK